MPVSLGVPRTKLHPRPFRYVYGGPGSQTVTSQYPVWGKRSKWHMYLASTGFLVASVDGRGTGGR